MFSSLHRSDWLISKSAQQGLEIVYPLAQAGFKHFISQAKKTIPLTELSEEKKELFYTTIPVLINYHSEILSKIIQSNLTIGESFETIPECKSSIEPIGSSEKEVDAATASCLRCYEFTATYLTKALFCEAGSIIEQQKSDPEGSGDLEAILLKRLPSLSGVAMSLLKDELSQPKGKGIGHYDLMSFLATHYVPYPGLL